MYKQKVYCLAKQSTKTRDNWVGRVFSCCARVPCATLVAFVMLCVGLGTLGGGILISANSIRLMPGVRIDDALNTLELIMTILIPTMVVIGAIFVAVATLLTGRTRRAIFWGSKRNLVGMGINITVMIFAYLLELAWLGITSLLVIPVISTIYLVFDSCQSENFDPNDCLYLPTKIMSLAGNFSSICGGEYHTLCNETREAMSPSIAALIGSVIITISMVHFLVSMGANHAYIRRDRPEYLADIGSSDTIENTKM